MSNRWDLPGVDSHDDGQPATWSYEDLAAYRMRLNGTGERDCRVCSLVAVLDGTGACEACAYGDPWAAGA